MVIVLQGRGRGGRERGGWREKKGGERRKDGGERRGELCMGEGDIGGTFLIAQCVIDCPR